MGMCGGVEGDDDDVVMMMLVTTDGRMDGSCEDNIIRVE